MSLLSKFLRLQFLFLLQAHINRTECIIGSAIENINWIDCEGYIKTLKNDDGESIVLDETFSVGAVCIDLENNTNCSCRFCNNSGGIYSCDGDRINSLPNVTKHADNEARLYCVMNARNVKLIGAYQFSGSSIREIKISNMDTLQIEQRAFSGILNLKTLAVTHSNLGILTNPRYIFAGLVNLTTLDLSYNKIIRWNTEILPKLKLLNLSGNPLTTLRNESFDWLQGSQLTHLILRECLLKHIEPGKLK
ncbi:hypothetical protein C0J52_25169 [Blattella germanica]|nr:hypothetical protein C0J52_25169 [Blattella germanica]